MGLPHPQHVEDVKFRTIEAHFAENAVWRLAALRRCLAELAFEASHVVYQSELASRAERMEEWGRALLEAPVVGLCAREPWGYLIPRSLPLGLRAAIAAVDNATLREALGVSRDEFKLSEEHMRAVAHAAARGRDLFTGLPSHPQESVGTLTRLGSG